MFGLGLPLGPDNQANRLHDDLFGKVTAQKPKELIVIEPIANVTLNFKYFIKVKEKTHLAKSLFMKGVIRFEKHMLALVTLLQKLRQSLVRSHISLYP